MEFQSIQDMLNFAISKERASERFYLQMAEQMNDSVTKRIFKTIAEMEKKHAEAIELEILKQGYTVSSDGDSQPDSEYEWTEQLEVDEQAQNMIYIDALQVAIQKERAAFQLYTQLIGMTKDVQFRKMLMELAEEEMRHVIQFEREYDTVSHYKE